MPSRGGIRSMAKLLYCWRCRMDVPMLDEVEWEQVVPHLIGAVNEIKRYRDAHGVTLTEAKDQARRAHWSRRRHAPSWRCITADHDPPYELGRSRMLQPFLRDALARSVNLSEPSSFSRCQIGWAPRWRAPSRQVAAMSGRSPPASFLFRNCCLSTGRFSSSLIADGGGSWW